MCVLPQPSEMEVESQVHLYGHTEEVTSLFVCKPYSILISVSRDGTCILWDLNRSERVKYENNRRRFPISFVCCLCLNESDYLWFFRLCYVQSLTGHKSPVTAVSASETTGDIATVCDSGEDCSASSQPLSYHSHRLTPCWCEFWHMILCLQWAGAATCVCGRWTETSLVTSTAERSSALWPSPTSRRACPSTSSPGGWRTAWSGENNRFHYTAILGSFALNLYHLTFSLYGFHSQNNSQKQKDIMMHKRTF